MINSSVNYERVSIEAVLTCKDDLHIGSGIESNYTLQGDLAKKNPEDLKYADICLDSKGAPYIPASSFRGYLAHLLRNGKNSNCEYALFGYANSEGNNSRMGKVRVYDATHLDSSDSKAPATHLNTRTAIEPITGTSKTHQLFTYKSVKTNSKFSIKIELDKPTDNEIQIFTDLLAYLDGSETSQIGKNKSLMMGRIELSEIKLKALSKSVFITWLQTENELDKYFQNIESFKGKKTDKLTDFKKIQLTLHPSTPVLVNDIHQVEGESGKPDQVFTRKGNKLCIPASSLKGLIRGHCRKILLTILNNDDTINLKYKNHVTIANQIIDEIFGDKQSASLIRISEAISTKAAIEHIQSFIAIDRFTGGAADSALYMACGAVVETLNFELYMHKNISDKNWALGLLVMALRDAMEGDMNIGWGKAKGYGAFQLSINDKKLGKHSEWPTILAKLKRSMRSSVEALEEKIQNLADLENAQA